MVKSQVAIPVDKRDTIYINQIDNEGLDMYWFCYFLVISECAHSWLSTRRWHGERFGNVSETPGSVELREALCRGFTQKDHESSEPLPACGLAQPPSGISCLLDESSTFPSHQEWKHFSVSQTRQGNWPLLLLRVLYRFFLFWLLHFGGSFMDWDLRSFDDWDPLFYGFDLLVFWGRNKDPRKYPKP